MEDIHGLKPFVFFAPAWKPMLLTGVGVLALIAVIVWFFRRRAEAVEGVLQPVRAVKARTVKEQLDALKAAKLIERGRAKDFHAGLSNIVREYLGGRFQLPGSRLTTTELLEGLEQKPMDPAIFQLIGDFLPECDLVKFADARPTVNDMEARLATAYYLVERLGDAPRPEAVEPEPAPDEPLAPPPPPPPPPPLPGGSLDVVG